MAGKWLQTLKQVAPRVNRVAIIFNPGTAPFSKSFVWVAEAAAPAFAAEIVSAGVHNNAELADVEEYANCRRRSSERLVGISAAGRSLGHGSPGTFQTCGLLFFPPAFF